MTRRIDLTGQRFGSWTAVDYAGNRKWNCVCDCGQKKQVTGQYLREGRSRQCMACAATQRASHGGKGSKLYRVWTSMISRCSLTSHHAYSRYGGRGIRVCTEWCESFAEFRAWADASGYAEGLSLDRIDNDGDYSPTNCHWATPVQQQRNKSTNRYVLFRGRKVLLVELAQRYGIELGTLYYRVIRAGWDIERAVSTPVRKGRNQPWLKLGISQTTYYTRKREGLL